MKQNPKTFNRRAFIRTHAFLAATAALLEGCRIPDRYAIPYSIQPHEVLPGMPAFYATAIYNGGCFHSLLAKVIDGRPVKLEGNDRCPIAAGTSGARAQAALMSLYNPDRQRFPAFHAKEIAWQELDQLILPLLETFRKSKQQLVILTRPIISPSEHEAIQNFQQSFDNCRVVAYDEMSASALSEAHEQCFGIRKVPGLNLKNARLVVAFQSDFMGSSFFPEEYTRQYTQSREKAAESFMHIQFESRLTLTGCKADQRIAINPSEEHGILLAIYHALASKMGGVVVSPPEIIGNQYDWIAEKLLSCQGESIVLSGTNETGIQILVAAINYTLRNYGQTLKFSESTRIKTGNDADLQWFLNRMQHPQDLGVIFYGTNPVYELDAHLQEPIRNLKLSVVIDSFSSETEPFAQFTCPAHHGLESWNDFEARQGLFHFAQPVIQPLFNTRQGVENFLIWSGNLTPYKDWLKNRWLSKYTNDQGEPDKFPEFWHACLESGIYADQAPSDEPSLQLNTSAIKLSMPEPKTGIELEIYENRNLGTGDTIHNLWLHELPDPLTRVCWSQYLLTSKELAMQMDLKTGDRVSIHGEPGIPVLIQPGQAARTISLAWGFGHSVGSLIGPEAGPATGKYVTFLEGQRKYSASQVQIEKTGVHVELPLIQHHHTTEGRPLELEAEPLSKTIGASQLEMPEHSHPNGFYSAPAQPGHSWAMAIDLNRCTGCGACVIACQAENNIPVVGPAEIGRRHEMHWLKVDRYFSGEGESTRVAFMPLMCQHCGQAPCESVCPVAATSHSKQGINQMVYNRCIGTRFCSNNCPYKVRVFNWYDYTGADSFSGNEHSISHSQHNLVRMALNPAVTVRSKGVMEKCSFCIQRISETIEIAKSENRKIRDGEVTPACVQTCAAVALVFGDQNDPQSRISEYIANYRSTRLLEELNTKPSVHYLVKIKRNG